MRALFITICCFCCTSFLNSQSCGNYNFASQAQVDNFVATNPNCNVLGEVRISADLDYSGLSFVDSIYSLYVDAQEEVDLNGLQNVIFANRIYIDDNAGISNLDLLNIQETSSVLLNHVDLGQCQFCPNLTELNYLSVGNAINANSNPFPNLIKVNGQINLYLMASGMPNFPTLQTTENLDIRSSTIIGNLSYFPSLDTVFEEFKIEHVSGLTSLTGLSNLDFVDELHIHDTPDLLHADLSTITQVNKLILTDPGTQTVSLPTEDINEFSCFWCSVTDLTFLNQLDTLNVLQLSSTQINDFLTLDSVIVKEEFWSWKNHNITSLDGLLFYDTLVNLRMLDNQNLEDIDALNAVEHVINRVIVEDNPKLSLCCPVDDLISSSNLSVSSIENNAEGCLSINDMNESCDDNDGDGIINQLDNCPDNPNVDQMDADNDGEGDVCDVCPVLIDVTLNTQAEVDSFFMLGNYDGCVINNLFIDVGSSLVDLRPLLGLDRIEGNLIIEESPNLQSLEGLDSLTYIGGYLSFFNMRSLFDLNGLRNLDTIGGYIFMESLELISSLSGLEGLEYIGGNVSLYDNFRLSNCCALAPFINGTLSFSGTITLSGSAPGCQTLTEVQTICADTDGDDLTDNVDNCPSIYNYRQDDQDKDGIGDICDNCPTTFNPDQGNQDGDAWGDACDLCPNTSTGSSGNRDLNNNGVGDGCELDAGSNDGFIGIGLNQPKSKIEVNDGDIYINNIHRGVILQSPNGDCFRVKVQNDGSVVSIPMICPQ